MTRSAEARRLDAWTEGRLDAVLAAVRSELVSAMNRHPAMASPHEGKAVIEEELDELWEHVKADDGRSPEALAEARQIAAMAVRYIVDLDLRGRATWAPRCDNHDIENCPLCVAAVAGDGTEADG